MEEQRNKRWLVIVRDALFEHIGHDLACTGTYSLYQGNPCWKGYRYSPWFALEDYPDHITIIPQESHTPLTDGDAYLQVLGVRDIAAQGESIPVVTGGMQLVLIRVQKQYMDEERTEQNGE